MTRYLLALALFAPTLCHAATPPVKPMAVCINQSTGVVTSRPKCKAGELPLTATVLSTLLASVAKAGPQGLKGDPGILNTASCYEKKDAYRVADFPIAISTVECNDPHAEFMVSDSMEVQPSIKLFLGGRWTITNGVDPLPTGVSLTTYAAATSALYQLRATIVCCKR